MSIYKFLDADERLTKKNFKSFQEARAFARENDLVCLTMNYTAFCKAFEKKVHMLKGHYNYEKLEAQAKRAMDANAGGMSHPAIAANDFMHRIIELPTHYIEDWLEGKNNLEWLPDYVSEAECSSVITYSRPPVSAIVNTAELQFLLKNGLQGIQVFRQNEHLQTEYDNALRYWSNSMGELHCHGKYDITEDELPAELQRVYREFEIFERFGSRCYLCETAKGYGIALVNEYDETFANDCKLSMSRAFISALADAASIRTHPAFQKAEIILGEEYGFEGCHELCVVFPAEVDKEAFYAAAAYLDSIAYKVAHELMRISPLLDLKAEDLPLRKVTLNALKHTGISTVGELLSYSPEQLKSLPSWGTVTVNDVKQVLSNIMHDKAVPNLKLWAEIIRTYAHEPEKEQKPSLQDQIGKAASQSSIPYSKEHDQSDKEL